MVENEVTKRITGAALAALLLFCACVPVPTNLQALDRVRYQKAYAGLEAAVLGSTPAAVLTLMAMAGVYVACHSDGEWLENSAAVASDFAQFVNENGYVNEYNCDISQYVDETGQNIDVQAAYAGGFYEMLQAYLNSQSAGQILGEGSNSVATHKRSVSIDGHDFPMTDSIPYANQLIGYSSVQELIGQGFALVGYHAKKSGNGLSVDYTFAKSSVAEGIPVEISYVNNGVWRANYQSGVERKYVLVSVRDNEITGNVSPSNGYWSHWDTSNGGLMMYTGANFSYQGTTLVPGAAVSEYAGVFDPASVQARVGEIANGAVNKVRIFEPTAEQLEAGYDYQTVLQNELAGISTGIEGLDAILNSILAVVTPLAGLASAPFSWLQSWWNSLTGWWAELLTWIRATPLGQFCSNVTEWLGATPFGNIAATVIDGVQAIPGAVAGAEQAVLEGVQAIPGAIGGTLEGIREGVLSLPLSIADVVAAVQAGVVDLTGALEGVMNFRPQWPRFDFPDIWFGDVRFTLPFTLEDEGSFGESLVGKFREKAPFCYVIAFRDAFEYIEYDSTPSFYLDLPLPEMVGGDVRLDAGEFMGYSFAGLTLAHWLRLGLTSFLVVGLVLAANKVWMGAAGRFGGE